MAMLRYGHAAVVEASVSPDAWTKSVCCGHKSCSCGTGGNCRTKVAKVVLAKYSPDKFLLSHCTIVASLMTEDSPTSKSDHKDFLIHPAFSSLVNNNGDAWTNKMLAGSYKTFVGANNYLEHVQIPELSKGKVIDAVLREVPVGKDKDGKDLVSYYVDILVATERRHQDLCRKIEAGITSSLSMGCKIAFSICSKCGNKAVDEAQACQHVRYEKGNTFVDESGVQRKVAELCGHYTEPDSVTFIDASWVANPAFTGAVARNIVVPSAEIKAKLQAAGGVKAYEMKDGDFLKVAAEDPAPGPTSEEPPAEETPPEEGTTPPAEDTPTDAQDDAPVEEQQAEEPVPGLPPESPMKTFKDTLKKKLLNQLSDEILSEIDGEDDDYNTSARPLETLDESLIQPTASTELKQTWRTKKAWDEFLVVKAGHMPRKAFNRLRFGSLMLLTSNDLTCLKDYGYSRRDFLAVMSFIDRCFKTPIGEDVKKSLLKIGSTKGRTPYEVLKDLVWWTGRRLGATEAKKALIWARLMDNYPN